MTKREVIKKFPITVMITPAMIKRAKRRDIERCVGALSLRKALKSIDIGDRKVEWGSYAGHLWPNITDTVYLKNTEYWERKNIPITTKEDINMMEVVRPTTVTFIINKK